MDEACKDALRLDFGRRLKLEFRGTKVTSDGGRLRPMGYFHNESATERAVFGQLLRRHRIQLTHNTWRYLGNQTP